MLLIKDKVLQEIDLIPEDKLSDLYNFVHQFRLRLEKTPSTENKPIMSFAGGWNDLPVQVFED